MRVAILGCGSIGSRHARNAVSLGERDVRLFDLDATRARSLASELSLPAVPTLAELWAWQPNVAIVATPSVQHVPLALEAARRGCDLFVEKPLGHSLEGVNDLITEARGRHLVTLVGCNMRFHPGPATVKRLIDEGAIGDVLSARLQTGSYLPDWRPDQDYRTSYSASAEQGGGAILDCIHEIDLALWYFGPAHLAASVTRPATSIGLDVDGFAELLLEHHSGVVSSIHLNFVQRDYRRGCQVIGSVGTIYWDFNDRFVTVSDGTAPRTVGLSEDWQINRMYLDEMTHFFSCVSSRRPTMAPLEAGRAALEIAVATRRRKTVAVIQARMSSTRLPNKVLADLDGRPMLAQVISRVSQVTSIDQVVVATSTSPNDAAIEAFCAREGIACFRGSEEDVLDRYYQAARAHGADVIVRITADCPLHDPAVIAAVVRRFDPNRHDYVSNTIERTYPDGLDTEVFSMAALERAWRDATWASEREHVTPYIWKRPDLFRIEQVTQPSNLSDLRWTVDEPRDLILVREVYRRLGSQDRSMTRVAELLAGDEVLRSVNAAIPSNEGYDISVSRDRIVHGGEGE